MLANETPGATVPGASPKSAPSTGILAEPCLASQYAYCRYPPGSRATMTCCDFSSTCQTMNPAATATVPTTDHRGTSGRPDPGGAEGGSAEGRRPARAYRPLARTSAS